MKDMEVTKISTLGELIKFHREKKHFSIKDLSSKTKIRSKQLESLEKNNYQELPNPVYLKGFLKTLSHELEMDLKGALAFLEEKNIKEEAMVFLPLGNKIEPAEFTMTEKSNGNKIILGAIGLFLCLIFALVVFVKYNEQITSALRQNPGGTSEHSSGLSAEITTPKELDYVFNQKDGSLILRKPFEEKTRGI